MEKNSFYIILFFAVGIAILGVFQIPLMDIDAAQYASISREMLEKSSYLQLYDQNKPYLDKPPMLFWWSALALKIGGIQDWVYRLPSLLFLGVALYATYQFASLYYSKQVARLSVLIFASSQAFFLMAHDVRTDTMLLGWVMLSIWLIAKWADSQKNSHFFLAMGAIAGGMMTKGPIALVVPVLCFAPQWFFEKRWAFFYKPIYLLGILFIGILLLPMSWGLYQQFDLHPGIVIGGVPIQSGLRFYYWTQSFGRYTGENVFNELNHFTFLLENMLWSYLPWIFIFLWALLDKLMCILKEGLFHVGKERISFFGFVLVYLILSRSQAQLPHYIFIVFPFASVLTAAKIQENLWNNTSPSISVKRFFYFHLFVFCLLIVAAIGIATIPFGIIQLPGKAWILFVCISFVLILIRRMDLGKKWVYLSLLVMFGVNGILNTFFYPKLLKYQMGNQLASIINENHWNKDALVLYKIKNSNALHFYGNHLFPEIKDSQDLRAGNWIITDAKNQSAIEKQFPKSALKYRGTRFHVTMLTAEFLNPSTRNQVCTNYVVLDLKK